MSAPGFDDVENKNNPDSPPALRRRASRGAGSGGILESMVTPLKNSKLMDSGTPGMPWEANVMVDVETMGTKPGCAVLSIGAVRFDPNQAVKDKDYFNSSSFSPMHLQDKSHFYLAINNLDSSARGFSSDPDTMRWWKKKDIWPQLSFSIMNSDITVPDAAEKFSEFLNKSHSGGGVKLWANSPSFDIAILRAMFKAVDQEFPVDYRQEMDYRTVMELAYPDRSSRPLRPAELNALPLHHALGDAAAQAHHLIIAAKCLELERAQSQSQRTKPTKPDIDTIGFVHGDENTIDTMNTMGGRHLMLEVKTLGRKKGSALLSIGAVVFDPTGRTPVDQEPDSRFHVVLNNFDMGNYGFGSDADTVRWWKSQPVWPSLSMESVQSGVPLVRALKQLTDFIGKQSPDKVWANSPTFDFEMLRDAYTATRLPFPIEYRQEMDYRTLMDLVYPDRSHRPKAQQADGMMAHHALGDAVGQARALVTGLSRLRLDLDAMASPSQHGQPGQRSGKGFIQASDEGASVAKRKKAFRPG